MPLASGRNRQRASRGKLSLWRHRSSISVPSRNWPRSPPRRGLCFVRGDGRETRAGARGARLLVRNEQPVDARVERKWRAEGIDGEEVSWSVGFGPRAQAGCFGLPAPARPARRRRCSIMATSNIAARKIADGPEGALPVVQPFRDTYYGGRAFANQLARLGFAVLVHDVFLWGSRRFPFEAMPVPAQWFSRMLPLTHYLRIVRGITLKGSGLPAPDRGLAGSSRGLVASSLLKKIA
jgi:hypothetical protein